MMQIPHTNNWSCMAASFSMALGIPFAHLLEIIGHDGSYTPYADKTIHQGFHIQECIDACLHLGFSCTEIQGYYGSVPFYGSTEIFAPHPLATCVKRFEYYIANTMAGVIAGSIKKTTGRTVGHAVAWDGKMIHDPRGYSYEFQNSAKHNFLPQTLWIIKKQG